ncbi:hypothetical protein PLICRDRAFT_40088 [Plicaturopsis crispa FD-325 SS-3]|nr:hypothetical protein PLICRDRAFT_40088 [Plicaturopsis crispa FD-325 SS-3]
MGPSTNPSCFVDDSRFTLGLWIILHLCAQAHRTRSHATMCVSVRDMVPEHQSSRFSLKESNPIVCMVVKLFLHIATLVGCLSVIIR